MKILYGFKEFIFRGNVIDLAVGIVVGAAFNSIVTALVRDIVMPIIGSFGRIPNFAQLFFMINGSRYMYGDFLNALISFLVIAGSVYFFVVVPVNTLISRTSKKSATPEQDPTKKCPECLSMIPAAAKRCAHCTSKLA